MRSRGPAAPSTKHINRIEVKRRVILVHSIVLHPKAQSGVAAHEYQTSVDVALLAPNAEVTVYPSKDPPELKVRTINRARSFLKAHLPAMAGR